MKSIADQMEQACYQVMEDGVVTCDLGGNTTTTEFTNAVIKKLGGY
jgi:3-isopropylmalate dehydrogenase